MGGNATFSGTNYQADVIAFVYAHILAQARLGWLPDRNDTPIAVSGETGGPGDDAAIEFDGAPAVELQAKHGLTAGAKLQAAFDQVRDKLRPMHRGPIVLAVDRSSSKRVYDDFARELDELRAGRWIRETASGPLRDLRGDAEVLERVFVVPIDLELPYHLEHKTALQLLRSTLDDPDQAVQAWAVMRADAASICARKLRRTRKDVATILTSASIKVRSPASDDRWHRQLDTIRQLIRSHHAEAALPLLASLDAQLGGISVEPNVRYRLAQLRASALVQRGLHEQALTSAGKALDIDPQGVHALAIAAHAAALSADLDVADAYARLAVEAHPRDPIAWVAAGHVAAARGLPLPDPPASVAGAESYQLLLIETAMSAGEWHRAIEISGELISSGVRTPDALFLRASSLANAGPSGDSAKDEARLRDVERLSTELLEAIGDDTHPFFTKALVLRSVSRRFLGREEEAAADLARATELQSGDPDAIRHAALARLSMDDPEGAVALLRHPATENDPHLLALRAEALASIPDEVGARSDIARALARAPDAASPDMVRLTAATAAINLTDPTLAEQALQGVSDSARSSFQGLLLRGRIAFLRDDISNGLQLFREASARNANARIGVLAELGYHLLRADRPSDAIEVYRELGDDSLPANAASFLARALFLTDNFAEAQRLIDRLAQKAPLPEWALAMSADIALQQENAQGAAEHLKVLVERTGDQGVRLELVRRLHELGRYAEAAPYLASLVASPAKPVQRMALAQLLSGVGRQQEALSIAFRAFRDAPSDARMHRAFVMLALAQGAVPTHDTIGADTYVRLKRPGGAERSYTIYADGPIDRLRQEISLDDARTLGLLNKRVGDVIASAVDQWHEGDWIVDEIKPAIVHVVQDAMMNYEARFSNEPFFIKAFSIGDGTSVRDFAPMVASLEGRREHATEAFKAYRDNTLPIGFVANFMGVSLDDVISHLTSSSESDGPLLTEWSNREGQDESVAAARAAETVVLTLPALITAESLGLLDQLQAFSLIAPRSLADTLREEIASAEKERVHGRKTLQSTEAGLRLFEVAPDHPLLVSRVEIARQRLQWLEEHVRLEYRPLVTIRTGDPREEEARDIIGRSSYDAVALTRHLHATMYADDLGLRRFIPKGQPGRSFSTVGLVAGLAERAIITAAARDNAILALIRLRHAHIPASRGPLEMILSDTNADRSTIANAFALLGGPAETPANSARIAMQVAKAHLARDVQVVGLETIVNFALEGMARAWPRTLCTRLVAEAADAEFALLPLCSRTVKQTCIEFLKR